jgi:ABC-type branched-subunit amino acid transport system substrate-binding protein
MKKRLVGALLAAAVVLAACGDDGDSTDTAGGAPGTTEAPSSGGPVAEANGIRDGKIYIGGVNQESAFAGIGEGAKARFDRFNEEGGIDGLEIEFLGSRDDGGDTDRNGALVRELVEKDKVFAILPSTPTYLQPATGDYLASKNVPYFGYGYAPVMCQDYAFAFNGCTVPGVAKTANSGNVASLLPLLDKDPTDGSGTKIALAGRAETGGDIYTDIFASISKELGMDVVYAEAKVPGGGTADMQPFADKIISSNPDIVQVITDFPSALALKAKLVQNGYKGIVADNVAYVPGLLDASPQAAAALEGTYVVTTYPTLLEDSPFAQQMKKDLEGVEIKSGTILGYLQADLFVSMLEKVSPNYDKFVETINGGVDIEPLKGGLPTKWPAFHNEGAPCNSVVKIENKKYVLSVPFDCYEALSLN